MSDSETQRIEEIFVQAVELEDTGARRAFLDQACKDDPALRAAVEEKLSFQPVVSRFFSGIGTDLKLGAGVLQALAGSSNSTEGPAAEPAVDEFAGRRIGHYKLLQKIGEGGCGAVYMAEQLEPVNRRVALKIIKLGMDTKSVIARFEVERQALAMMDHPNIARVLDAGATETGRPFFVMELVRGVKITTYCDHNNLDTSQRLEIFIQVCQAIQHAHQKGIIHRDVKPSNILVTMHDGVPVPKVIDFGIAKAREGKLTDNTLFTAYDQFIGTPAYMSPEQAEMSGFDVDTRSDIYSLGVLLYELLTGKTPFDQKQLVDSGLDEMRRTLREKEPQRPSRMVTSLQDAELATTASHRHIDPPRLISILKGDLDWIVMKALEKDRRRRYESAHELAADVQRYMNNEPVAARPPSRLYRMQKLAQRNKVAFAAGAVVALTLVAGMSISTWMFIRERESLIVQMRLRQQAEIATADAERARAKEAKLRQEAEAGERISQAAFLISQGKIREADVCAADVLAANIKPSLETEGVFRTLGIWHAVNGRWEEAAARFNLLLLADQNDKSWTITDDLLMAGPILIERGDLEGYEKFRRAIIPRYAGTADPVFAERALKISLLLPADPQVMASLKPLRDLSLASLEGRTNLNDYMVAWRCISVALMAYRQADASAADMWCQRCLNCSQEDSTRNAIAHVIRAMACQQKGETVQARSELETGRSLIESKLAGGLHKGSQSTGYWYNWLFAQILRREAEALIEQPSAGD